MWFSLFMVSGQRMSKEHKVEQSEFKKIEVDCVTDIYKKKRFDIINFRTRYWYCEARRNNGSSHFLRFFIS
ncbi:hypothetical protein GCM10020370_51080 [Paenibacillus hodogayensis]